MKKFLMLLLIVFIFVSNSFAFSDESSFVWAKEAINNWNSKGYISGYPDGTFRGNNNITRAEVIAIINKLNNSNITTNKRPSKDINSGNWFYEDMGKATSLGLISVDANGNLRPNDFATREEVMVILSKLLNITYSGSLDNAKVKRFSDSNQISSSEYKRVAGIVEEGFVNGYKDNTLRPKANITRAEFMCVLDNAISEVISYGNYNNKALVGNVVINGENVRLTNSEILGKVFVLDGAKDDLPDLINTKVSKGINSRVGEILIKNFDDYETLTEYNYNNPEEYNEPVFGKLIYSEDEWTNDDVDIKVSFNNDDAKVIDSNRITAKKNDEYIIEYVYKGKRRSIVAKVTNIDKTAPVVTAKVENMGPYATVTVEVDEDGLSPLTEINCSNGTVYKTNSETGEIEKTIIINIEGDYTITAKDEAGNVGSVNVKISDLREPDVTYKIEHYLQDEFGNYPTLPVKTVDAVGEGKTVVNLADIEKVNETGFMYVYGTLDNNTVTEITLAENIVVKLYYARYFTISYNGNDGSNVPEAQNKILNEEIKISDNIPVKEGYKFMGWSTAKDDTTIKYNPGDAFTENTDTTLYAVWKGIDVNYKVEHYLQQYDGTYLTTPSSVSDVVGENYSVKLVDDIGKVQEANYVFGHAEFDGQEVTEVVLAEGSVIKLFYKYQYTISFRVDAQTSYRPSPQKKFFGEEITLTKSVPDISNYKCIGWSLEKDGTKVDYYPGDKFNLNEDTVLYAVKTIKTIQYSIKTFLQQEDGSYTAEPQDSKAATNKALTEIEVKNLSDVQRPPTGYAFDYAELDGNRIESFILNENDHYKHIMLYFKREYTVSYDTNGGDEAPEATKKYIGTSINITDIIPTKTDCEFLGWSTDKVDLTTIYNPGDPFDKNEDTILYAIWKENTASSDGN